ncbi:hypothetical protein V492_06287 [Pseudogymnoascus sp. VKM F-4246]|nr:hypothetical protein V492_06287 [Pseudogymnoascus sp. VKM F-4246]
MRVMDGKGLLGITTPITVMISLRRGVLPPASIGHWPAADSALLMGASFQVRTIVGDQHRPKRSTGALPGELATATSSLQMLLPSSQMRLLSFYSP